MKKISCDDCGNIIPQWPFFIATDEYLLHSGTVLERITDIKGRQLYFCRECLPKKIMGILKHT